MQPGGLVAFTEQDAQSGASTPRRSRVSSIFQQKTIKPDDIDAEFLKHVQFAAQRSSPTPAAPADPVSAFDVQTDFPAPDTVSGIAAPSNTSTLVMTQPVAIEEFTLDKIEQSIADIEAELGWTSEGAAATSTVSTAPASEDKVTSTAAPSGILSTAHASRFSAAPQAASAGTPNSLPELPHPKRLSFMGELTSQEPTRRASQLASSAASTAKLESGSSLSVMPASTAVADTNKEAVTDSNTAAEQPTILSSAESSLQEVPRLSLEGSRQLDHSLSEANLGSLSSRSLDASKRQLTSLHSMQSKPAQEASKKRAVRHSASGKIAVPGPNGSYSSRYANRQLSGKASPVPSESGLSSGKRSLVTSPTASVHGGQGIPAHLAGRLSGGRPAAAVGADDRPGQTLAGAAAMLSGKMHARPSSSEGAGWHLATGDGLPFSPRGSLVASSGGSRTLRPIASQQEALFDAEGNLLPRHDGPHQEAESVQSQTAQPLDKPASAADAAKLKAKAQSKLGTKQSIKQDEESAPQQDLISAKIAEKDARHKPKHGMLSIVMFPCLCMRPRTNSTEDPYLHGSLRQRYSDKEVSSPVQMASLSSKGMPAPKSALKQKHLGSALVTEPSNAGWDLGTHVHQADAAGTDSSEVELREAEDGQDEEQTGRSLQGAISLAPKRASLTDTREVPGSLQETSIMEDVISPAGSFTSQRSTKSMVPGNEALAMSESESQADTQSRSRTQTRSQSHEDEGEGAASSAAVVAAEGNQEVSPPAAREGDAAGGEPTAEGGAGTRDSDVTSLGMTGRSASSRSTTQRRKEWEGPEVGTPDEVSQSLEDMMVQRFPELQALLVQSSFTNKSAPWRPIKSGHTSHAASRATSLGVSREASFTHSRPESRTGHLPLSHLGDTFIEAAPAEQPVQAVAAEPGNTVMLDSNSMAKQTAQHSHVYDEEEGADVRGTMPLVEAAALGASSPGAVVRVPTSTTLSQADQIALRYQHQVQFQLQQTMGGSAVAPLSGRSASKSPARRSPTKHRPFHLSNSPWKTSPSDTAPIGNSQTLPAANRQPASPRKGQSPSRTKGLAAKGASPVKKQAERRSHQAERQSPPGGAGTSQSAYNPGAMSFGSYGGVAFSSFAPATPAGIVETDDAAADVDDEDWADDSGKWGELTRTTPAAISKPAVATAGPPALAAALQGSQPKQSSISLAAITADAAEEDEEPILPDQASGGSGVGGAGGEEGLRGPGTEASRSYLSLLESLAREGEFGSPGNSDSEPSPTTVQAPKQQQPWREMQAQGGQDEASSSRLQHSEAAAAKPVSAEVSHTLSDISNLDFGDDAVEAPLPDEASDAHMHGNAADQQSQVPALSSYHWLPPSNQAVADDIQTGGAMPEPAEQPSALALALAALAATAAQKQSAQQAQQQPLQQSVLTAAAAEASPAAEDQVSLSSASSGDVLADAAAAAAAAGLSRRREAPLPQQPEATSAANQSSQASVRPESYHPGAAKADEAEFESQSAQQAQQQEGKRQRESASGDWPGPTSSAPSWSGAANDPRGIGQFQAKHAVNYVGKSARRPKVATPPPKVGRLQGFISKLRRGGSKQEEEYDLSRPASIAGPRPLDSEAELLPAAKSGTWMPKAFSRAGSDGAALPSSPAAPQGRTRFADEPPLASQAAQPDLKEEQDGPLPSRKAPPETFTALPSLPVPGPIAADPLLPATSASSASKTSQVSAAAPVSRGVGKGMKASGLLVVRQEMSQGRHMPQSSSGSGSDDEISEMSVE